MICNKCGAECVENTKYCASCGELLETEPAQSVVPEFTNTTVNNSQKSGDGYAITSMILGIASFFFCSLITGILAIVFGKKAKANGQNNSMATAGIIMGAISLGLCALGVVFWIIYFILIFAFSLM